MVGRSPLFSLSRIALFLFLLCFATSCTSKSSETLQKPVPLSVSFAVIPSVPKIGEPAVISVRVEQQGKPVNDADEVKFEIWKKGSGDHQIIQAVKKADGLYGVQETFKEPDTYYVMYHVTARDLHKMIQYEVRVQK
jgi:hypothetical protein